ncbi:MAG: hypothetical protein KF858_15150 [Candidatus Sumerlaeia bacterium]|nr:hypothetical protein [Candidatus Sumerlaeia bacterium]
MNDQEPTRRAISRLMREAAALFAESPTPDIVPALPKMRAAVHLAEGLHDKTPLVICESHLASMNAVCGMADQAMEHIERALAVVREHDLAVPIRNFAYTKFVEIAILVRRDQTRAQAFALGLLECAVDEEGSYPQYLATLFNLAVLSHDLLDRREWALALLSWLEDELVGDPENLIGLQGRRYAEKVLEAMPEAERLECQTNIEVNRDAYLEEATSGFLPRAALRRTPRQSGRE